MTNQTFTDWYAAGMEAWHSGDLDSAIDSIRNAIALLHPDDHLRLSEYLGALGGVLAQRGDIAQADDALTSAVSAALSGTSTDQRSPIVLVPRYFLAEHFLRTARPAEALSALESGLGSSAKFEPLLRTVEALAAHALGDTERARRAAGIAIDGAAPGEQRTRVERRLRPVVQSGD